MMHEQIKSIISDLHLTVLYLFLLHSGNNLLNGILEDNKLAFALLPLWGFAVFQVISITNDKYEQKKKEEA